MVIINEIAGLASEARGLAAWAVRELTDAKLSDLAGKFGRDASTLSAAIKRFDIRRKNEPELAEKAELIQQDCKFQSCRTDTGDPFLSGLFCAGLFRVLPPLKTCSRTRLRRASDACR